MMHVPAPVGETKQIVAPTVRKRTGLMGARPMTDHRMRLGDIFAHVRARPNEDSILCECKYICLHEKCAGKSWATLAELHEGHPPPSDMARREEAHVYALWSDSPVDAAKVETTKIALERAEKNAKRARTAADGSPDDDALESKAQRFESIATKARTEHDAAAAPIGLIAPPEMGAEQAA